VSAPQCHTCHASWCVCVLFCSREYDTLQLQLLQSLYALVRHSVPGFCGAVLPTFVQQRAVVRVCAVDESLHLLLSYAAWWQ
jgi:hypothetical protein